MQRSRTASQYKYRNVGASLYHARGGAHMRDANATIQPPPQTKFPNPPLRALNPLLKTIISKLRKQKYYTFMNYNN